MTLNKKKMKLIFVTATGENSPKCLDCGKPFIKSFQLATSDLQRYVWEGHVLTCSCGKSGAYAKLEDREVPKL
jgi:hypothetical protein